MTLYKEVSNYIYNAHLSADELETKKQPKRKRNIRIHKRGGRKGRGNSNTEQQE